MKPPTGLTRREFLKLSAAGLLGGLLAEIGWLPAQAAFELPVSKQGRMVYSGSELYDAPSFKANVVRLAGRDEVLEIAAETTGGNPSDYNRLWYRFADGLYTYSGWVQPVETRLNPPVQKVPPGGQLAEVSVPFTQVHLQPGSRYRRGQRLYYGATFWVLDAITNPEENTTWYKVEPRREKGFLYLQAEHLRLIPNEELTLLSAAVPPALKLILVDLTTQSLTAFEDDEPVLITRISSGAGGTRTPTGIFRTYHKGPSIHMFNQDDHADYDLPGVPWVSFFTGTGISFHGTYWHNDFGIPRSHGCVNLNMAAAKFIYRWSLPVVPPGEDYIHMPGQGTLVQIIA